MNAATAPSSLACSILYWIVRKMLLFHSPSQRPCGCLAILSKMAAFSGSFARMLLARSIEFEFGSTHSLTFASGLPVAFGGLGDSVIGPSSPGSVPPAFFGALWVEPEGLLACGELSLCAQAPNSDAVASRHEANSPKPF